MKRIFIYFLLLFSFNSKADDTLFLKLHYQDKLYLDTLDIVVFNDKNEIVNQLNRTINSSNEIEIIVSNQKKYNIFIKAPFSCPILLINVIKNKHYLPIHLFYETIIKDTIIVEPTDLIWTTCIDLPLYLLKYTDLLKSIKKWESAFHFSSNYSKLKDTSSEISCTNIGFELLIDIYKPKALTWNNFKYFLIPKIQYSSNNEKNIQTPLKEKLGKYYICNNYFTITPCYFYINKDVFSENELYYFRVIFNIYELNARKLRKFLSSYNAFRLYKKRELIIAATYSACHNQINRFNDETQCGKNIKLVKEWYKAIYYELQEYDNEKDNSYKWFFD